MVGNGTDYKVTLWSDGNRLYLNDVGRVIVI